MPVTNITCMLLIPSAFVGYSVAGSPKPLPTFSRSFDDFAKLDLSYGPMQELVTLDYIR